jgi:hypothetical protein
MEMSRIASTPAAREDHASIYATSHVPYEARPVRDDGDPESQGDFSSGKPRGRRRCKAGQIRSRNAWGPRAYTPVQLERQEDVRAQKRG